MTVEVGYPGYYPESYEAFGGGVPDSGDVADPGGSGGIGGEVLLSPGEPRFSNATERFWRNLPAHYRAADEAVGWQFKRWLSGILDVLGDVEHLVNAIDYVPRHEGGDGSLSRLADPLTAPVEWLPWLAQVVGVRLTNQMSDREARDAVYYAPAGWRSGTVRAVRDAARSALTGTRHVEVHQFSTAAGVGAGGPFDVLLITRHTETPDVAGVLRTVDVKGAKPAGVVLHHLVYRSSWAAAKAKYPTWAAIRAAGSWSVVMEAGLS